MIRADSPRGGEEIFNSSYQKPRMVVVVAVNLLVLASS